MDRDEFVSSATQNLVRISGGWAFLPPALPPNFAITPALLRAADSCRGAVGELTGSARLSGAFDELTLMVFRPILVNEAVSTARIEGIHTQVVDLVIQEAIPGATRRTTSKEDHARVLEAQNAAATVELGWEWLREGRALAVPLVKDLHSRILQDARGEEHHRGEFRARQVWLGRDGSPLSEATYVPPPPEHVAPLLENLMRFLDGPPVFGSLIDSAIGHYQFEATHPFEDGNGRLGRALVPLHLIRHGVLDRPWLVISSALESRREEYLSRLKRVSTHDDWSEWVLFFLTATEAQARDSLRRVERVFDLREAYRERVSRLPSSVPARALDFILSRVFVSVGDVAEATRTSYPTAKSAVEELTKLGILEPWGKLGARQHWHAAQLLAEVYEAKFQETW